MLVVVRPADKVRSTPWSVIGPFTDVAVPMVILVALFVFPSVKPVIPVTEKLVIGQVTAEVKLVAYGSNTNCPVLFTLSGLLVVLKALAEMVMLLVELVTEVPSF